MVRPYHWGGVPPHWQNLELEHIYIYSYDPIGSLWGYLLDCLPRLKNRLYRAAPETTSPTRTAWSARYTS